MPLYPPAVTSAGDSGRLTCWSHSMWVEEQGLPGPLRVRGRRGKAPGFNTDGYHYRPRRAPGPEWFCLTSDLLPGSPAECPHFTGEETRA